MNAGLFKLIRDYQQCVARAVALLEASGIARPRGNAEWAASDVPGRGTLANGFKFYKHGFGCALSGREWSVDFDFGEHGEIDGFDAWRLHLFAGSKLASYGFTSREDIERAVAAAASSGVLRFSGDTLYYLAADDG
jgi:hypothetical protein